ncbi:MAG: hypothetical protein HYX32_06595 [Actinobacteria bacterium]|nr:hypothetical protein [Actinomycetota bacterium]
MLRQPENRRVCILLLRQAVDESEWRVAYKTSYGIYRHAAEAVDLDSGYRVLASPGAHLATFALAAAVMGDATGVFDTVNASTMSGTRNKLEYVNADHPEEVTEDDARRAVQLAERSPRRAMTRRRPSTGPGIHRRLSF